MYYTIIFFVFGLVLGSFYTVVGLRLPNNESIIKPRSHCPNCKRKLKWYELIPIFSYIIQRGKCRGCKKHISIKYPLYELLTGICFALSYIVFGLSLKIIMPLTLISLLIIVIISDIEYMIIPDEIIIFGSILLIVETLFINGMNGFLASVVNSILFFITMYLIKKVGDFIFKKESLGGGDIKLMTMIGICFHIKTIVVIIFIASFIALPYAIIVMLKKKEAMVPYGPFLSLTSIALILLKQNFMSLIDLINYIV